MDFRDKFSKGSFSILFVLLGISIIGINFDAHAQSSSLEEAMAALNEIHGTYTNERFGILVDLPASWSGPRTDYENPQAPQMDVFGFQINEGGPNNPSLDPPNYITINLTIINRLPPMEEFDSGIECNFENEEFTWNGKKVNKVITVCEGIEQYSQQFFSSKSKSYHFSQTEKNIMFTYSASPKELYDQDVSKFDASFETLKMDNLIDITYEPNISSSEISVPPTEIEISEIESESPIPAWIKNNIEWWVQDQIDDQAFIQGLQFLIKEGIMVIPETAQAENNAESQEVPNWIKSNADWWAQGLITDDDFLKGITFLVENGIIVV